MKDVMAIVNLTENEEHIRDLTPHRSLAAVPFGGRYRLIDFVLSNLVHAGIINVGVLAEAKFRSLVDHVGSGKEWDLDRHREGLYLLPPGYTADADRGAWRRAGDIDNFFRNMDYMTMSKQEYVIVTGSSMICAIDYRDMVQYHKEQGADITVVYKRTDMANDSPKRTMLNVDKEERITDIEVNPRHTECDCLSMKMYVMKKKLLMDLVDTVDSKGGSDFVKDALIPNLSKLKMFGYEFKGYLAKVDSLASYYKHSMELLSPEVWSELFYSQGVVYTKIKNEAPAKYLDSCKVDNSLVANACIIEGTVENSILFRGVKVKKGAVVRNSIVMQKSVIGENAHLNHAILDKGVVLSEGSELSGEATYPVVIHKDAIV